MQIVDVPIIYELIAAIYGIALLVAFPLLLVTDMDPTLGCLTLGGAFLLGAVGRPFWTAVSLAIAATMLNNAQSLSQWLVLPSREDGLIGAGLLLGLFGVLCVTGWYAGRLANRLVHRAIQLCHGARAAARFSECMTINPEEAAAHDQADRPVRPERRRQLIDGRNAPVISLFCVMERTPNVEGKGHA